jgi:hypothetical protein
MSGAFSLAKAMGAKAAMRVVVIAASFMVMVSDQWRRSVWRWVRER